MIYDGCLSSLFSVTTISEKDNSKIIQATALQFCESHKPLCLFFCFIFIFFSSSRTFFFSLKPLCAPCVKWEMCLGKDGHKYISRDSWEGLEKRNPSCRTAEYFCELLFTSCWTSSHLFTFYFASYVPDKSLFIHMQGWNNSFYS